MFFRKTTERRRLLQFFYEAYFDNNRQSENWIEEIAFQLKPEIDRQSLKIYLIEFLENGWIVWDKERSDAYIITDKGILRYSEGFLMLAITKPIQNHIIVILMIIAILTTWFIFLFS